HALGVRVTGHIWRCDLADAVGARMDGLDNTSRIPRTELSREALMRFGSVAERLATLARLWDRADPVQLEETAHAMAEAGIAWVPCLVLFEAMTGDLDDVVMGDRDWPSGADDPRPR